MAEMNNVFDALYTALDGVEEISGKVYAAEVLKDEGAPFCFWLQSSEDAEETLTGDCELQEADFEVHICTEFLDDLYTIGAAVRNALLDLMGETKNGFLYERIRITSTSPMIIEREVGYYRKVYSIRVNYQTVSDSDT